ncbi:acetyl-CoA synthetase-like protein [Melanomma pulvis-pyrius CBS 109.77]|uniref:Acetyl-CoA synthetase-like protein n=1 Tax=Melanomma pulvis-pyrius CBS 109.77 TaxID=1314802 RepID=A0A6A6X6R4_9PLEO|nr:acetyl-CoA synthetase-like protein [Melanomma pulvis-pyrius CBS 109.77]
MQLRFSSSYILPGFDARYPPARDSQIKTAAELIDFNADNNPNYLFCLQAEKSLNGGEDPSVLRITHKSFRGMILSCQLWLLKHIKELQLPREGDGGIITKGAPIALLLDSDVGLLVHFFALLGLGVPALLLSTRLSPLAIQSLLAQTRSCALLASPRHSAAANQALMIYQTKDAPPTLYFQPPYQAFIKTSSRKNHWNPSGDIGGDYLDFAENERYYSQSPWDNDPQVLRDYSAEKVATKDHYVTDTDRNVFILQSSGTTGLPKPIFQTHRYLMSYAPQSSFEPESSNYIFNEQTMAFSTLPLFDCFGLMAPMMSLSIGKPFAIPPTGFIPTAASTVHFMSTIAFSTLFIEPSILQGIAELPESQGVRALQWLQYIACGSGALSTSIGEKLAEAGTRVITGFVGTEVGSLGVLQPPGADNDWKYFRLRQDRGCRVREVSPIRPGASPRYKISVRPPGWTEDFEISDYFVTNSMTPGRDSRTTERADDVLALKPGEKVQLYTLETVSSGREDVRAALALATASLKLE